MEGWNSKGITLHVDLKVLRGVAVPNLSISSLKFRPRAFVVESPRLDGRIVESDPQVLSYTQFSANPCLPMTYVCAGNPDDVKARFFVAHLAMLHARHMVGLGKTPRIAWEQMFGGFDNPAMRHEDLSLLVIDNLSSIPNKVKYDKTRDLLAKYQTIPKLLVVSGEDPVSFAATRIFSPAHGIAYFPTTLVNSAQTVI